MKNNIFGEKIDLTTRLHPNDLWRRVTATSDAQKIVFFAPTGFEGDKRFLYTVSGSEIKVRLRQRNKGIPPILKMKIEPTGEGSRILGKIAVEKSSWIFLSIFWLAFLTIGVIFLFSTTGKLLARQPFAAYTPFDLIAPFITINLLIFSLRVYFKVKRDTGELFKWLEKLIADSIIKL